MPLARFQSTAVTDSGDVIADPNIEVREQITGKPLASIYSDRLGASPLANPFQGEPNGDFAFHAPGGAYQIRAYTGPSGNPTSEKIWSYVGIGTNSERDFSTVYPPQGAWNGATTYSENQSVSHQFGANAPYSFVSIQDGNLNNEPQFDGSGVPQSDAWWQVLGLIEAPGLPGSSDVTGTSTTSLTPSIGSNVFTIVENDRGWGVGSRLRVSSAANPDTDWAEGTVTAYSGNTLDLDVDLISSSIGAGPFADWSIGLAGARGVAGADPGVVFQWDDAITDADPGSGDMRADAADLSAATQLFVSKTSLAGVGIAAFLLGLDDSTSTDKGGLLLKRLSDDVEALWRVIGVTDATGYVKISVNGHAGATDFAATDQLSFQFTRTGNKGADGAGTGDVIGPASSTTGRAAIFSDGTGKNIDEAAGAPFLIDVTGQVFSGGAEVSTNNLGTPAASATVNLDPSNGPHQKITNNNTGITLVAPTKNGDFTLRVVNGASAGALTFSGFASGINNGDSLTTTNGDQFDILISRIDGVSDYEVRALQ